jgi:hypothetical protein
MNLVSRGFRRMTGGQGGRFRLRPYCLTDKHMVWDLLTILPQLYPNGDAWLDKRLAESLEGKANCTVAVWCNRIAGITIETRKGKGVVKLSTIWVSAMFRRMGIGRALLSHCCEKWAVTDTEYAYVTADFRVSPVLSPLLSKHGFRFLDLEADRYGEGRDEAVFYWTPQNMLGNENRCES